MVGQLLVLLTYMLIFSIALMLVAFGGMFSERSGIINIGLEGIMVVGGFSALLVLSWLNKTSLPSFLVIIIAILTAILAGMVYSLLLAVVCINFKADQTLVGTAMNLLSTALALILTKRLSGGVSTSINYNKDAFIIPLVFKNGLTINLNVFLFIGLFILVLALFLLHKTRFGLRLKSCGENPSAADSVGINVRKYRYAGVLISGALGGLGSLAYILPTQSFWNSASGVAGFGFLALAVMIFGQWKPLRIFVVALLFSFFMSLSYIYYDFFDALLHIKLTAETGVTKELFNMLPFIASLILLAFTSKKSRAPKAEGIPYDKGAR
ncbi:MAG: ABC transporter permease [Erysipelotrichaceae bacterium]|nr:ABC transporter permease [Erysipelotrichaceae bacterium]